MRKPLLAFREATGLYKKMKYVMFICAICNIVLSIVFGAHLSGGVAGIILASFISKLLTSFWYEPVVLYKDYFEEKVWRYFADSIVSVFFCVFVGMICRIIVGRIAVTGVVTWIMKGIICTVIVNAFYFLRYFKTDEFKNVFSKIVKNDNNKYRIVKAA